MVPERDYVKSQDYDIMWNTLIEEAAKQGAEAAIRKLYVPHLENQKLPAIFPT